MTWSQLLSLLASEGPAAPGPAYWVCWAVVALVGMAWGCHALTHEVLHGFTERRALGKGIADVCRALAVPLFVAVALHACAMGLVLLRLPIPVHLATALQNLVTHLPAALLPAEGGLVLELHLTKLALATQLVVASVSHLLGWPGRRLKHRAAQAVLARLEQLAIDADAEQKQSSIRYY